MDYVRKKRNITYHSPACKMYLRHDFSHKCAYCGAIEEVLSFIPESADKLFEKDHFLPQSDQVPNVHNYPNLFYSCSTCNGKKDAITLPLNPCCDNIFSGENPHVQGGTAETDYIVDGASQKGEEYISALELNSRYHIEIRKKQNAWLSTMNEGQELLRKMHEESALSSEALQVLDNIFRYNYVQDPLASVCGGSKHAGTVINVCKYLEAKGYQTDILLEENELDIQVDINGSIYWGTVHHSESLKECRFKTEVLNARKQDGYAYGVFAYDSSTKSVHFFQVDFNTVDWNKKEYHTSSYVSL